MKQELLMEPGINELSDFDKELILAAQSRVEIGDPFYFVRNGGFHPDVHPVLMGYQIDRDGGRAIPVYKTDNGLFAVDHHPKDGSSTSWSVEENEVYS